MSCCGNCTPVTTTSACGTVDPCSQVCTALEVVNSWNVPACGEEANLKVSKLSTVLIGSYIWNPTYGWFEITGFNSVTGQLRVKNNCTNGNAAEGTVVPALTLFVFGSPPLDAMFMSGAGSPEGVVVAPVGTVYSRTDGARGTSLYVKNEGASSTGWVAIPGAFSVLTYGASTSATAAVNTVAIQTAIDTASTAGWGTVAIPPGTYQFNGISVPRYITLQGAGAKVSNLIYAPVTGNGVTLTTPGVTTSYVNIFDLAVRALTTSSGIAIAGPADPLLVTDVKIDRYEVEGFLRGIYIPFGLQVHVGMGRLLGRGPGVAGGVGVQLGDRTLGTPREINTAVFEQCYASGYETSFISDGSIHKMIGVTSENATNAVLCGSRLAITGSWIQATTLLYETRAGGWTITVDNCYHLDGANVEVPDPSTMSSLPAAEELSIFGKSNWIGAGRFRYPFATTKARAVSFGSTGDLTLHNESGSARFDSTARVLEVNRVVAAAALSLVGMYRSGTAIGGLGVDASDNPRLIGSDFTTTALSWDTQGNVAAGLGGATIATNATNGFLRISGGAGAPTGAAAEGSLYIDFTNNKLYFRSTGAWRDAGP